MSPTRLLHRSDEPTGVGRGEARPSVSQPRLPLQPDKPAGGGLTVFAAGVVFDRSGHPPNCACVRTAVTGASLPAFRTRRFQAVKARSCRSYAAKGWHEDLTLPKIQSLPAAIPGFVAIIDRNSTAHGQQAARGTRARNRVPSDRPSVSPPKAARRRADRNGYVLPDPQPA